MRLGQFDKAAAVLRGGAGARARCAWFHELDLALALMQSDDAAATREIAWFQGREDECLNLDLQASRALVLGQRRRASALLREAASQGSRQKLEGPPTVIEAAGADPLGTAKSKAA